MGHSKLYSVLNGILFAGAFCVAGSGYADTTNVEVQLGQVFIPATGYGTNNNIEVTLDGILPNSCYQLGKATVEKGADPFTLVVHQYADRETSGVCADEGSLPGQLANVIPYTYDLSIGRLDPGTYKILFNQTSNFPRTREFQVYQSKNLSADDFPYAAVSTLSMPDVVNGMDSASVHLMGSLTSSCSFLSDVRVTREDDVIVVQPILGFNPGSYCAQVMLPFNKKVNLGKFAEGRYLVHVRAMSGRSLSHAFSAVIPDPSIR